MMSCCLSRPARRLTPIQISLALRPVSAQSSGRQNQLPRPPDPAAHRLQSKRHGLHNDARLKEILLAVSKQWAGHVQGCRARSSRLAARRVLHDSAISGASSGGSGLDRSPPPTRKYQRLCYLADPRASGRSIASATGLDLEAADRLLASYEEANTLTNYLQHRRLAMACQHLRGSVMGSVTVAETARSCGFADPDQFSDVFARIIGSTPDAYRVQFAAVFNG